MAFEVESEVSGHSMAFFVFRFSSFRLAEGIENMPFDTIVSVVLLACRRY